MATDKGLRTPAEWSLEETMHFLELYSHKPVLWDPKNKFKRDSLKLKKAWEQLSKEMKRSISDLKAKKMSLMATFRQHFRRKKQSLQSCAEFDEVYNPVWYYYSFMESFLAPEYKSDGSSYSTALLGNNDTTEEGLSNDDMNSDELNAEHSMDSINEYKNIEVKKEAIEESLLKKRKRRQENIEEEDSMNNMSTVCSYSNSDNECDLYGQLIALRLREYSKEVRRYIMYEFDKFLLEHPAT